LMPRRISDFRKWFNRTSGIRSNPGCGFMMRSSRVARAGKSFARIRALIAEADHGPNRGRTVTDAPAGRQSRRANG
jgi:hypothetical protein